MKSRLASAAGAWVHSLIPHGLEIRKELRALDREAFFLRVAEPENALQRYSEAE